MHLFVLLDNEVEDVKQTFWKYDYSDSPYLKFTNKKMSDFLKKKVDSSGNGDKFSVFVR